MTLRAAVWSLTDKGRSVEKLSAEQALQIFREVHREFVRLRTQQTDDLNAAEESDEVAPDESDVVPAINYKNELLEVLRNLPSSGFERFCQRLLRESGFEQVTVTGRSGDGGIDGIGLLQVNPLVSFKVLFQCKRYSGAVGAGHVRDFRGAMMGRADKGIILTTGSFTADAKREAIRDGVPPIELVDGEKLLRMLEELELGLVPKKTYELDTHFFDEFRA